MGFVQIRCFTYNLSALLVNRQIHSSINAECMKRLLVHRLLGWVFIVMGMYGLFRQPIAGLVFLSWGLLLLPFTNKLAARGGWQLTGWQQLGIVVVGIALINLTTPRSRLPQSVTVSSPVPSSATDPVPVTTQPAFPIADEPATAADATNAFAKQKAAYYGTFLRHCSDVPICGQGSAKMRKDDTVAMLMTTPLEPQPGQHFEENYNTSYMVIKLNKANKTWEITKELYEAGITGESGDSTEFNQTTPGANTYIVSYENNAANFNLYQYSPGDPSPQECRDWSLAYPNPADRPPPECTDLPPVPPSKFKIFTITFDHADRD